jgi:hypothetical protein
MYVPLAVFASPGLAALWRITMEQWRNALGGRSFGQLLRTYGTRPP